MKKTLIFILSLFYFASCGTKEYCEFPTKIIVPSGWQFDEIAAVESPGAIKDFQFVSDSVGFALLGEGQGIMKTTDGGVTWEIIPTNVHQNHMGLFFDTEDTGYIPLARDSVAVQLLKTTDGGHSWTKYEYPNIEGSIYHITKGPDGFLYAVTRAKFGGGSTLIRSKDEAQTMEIVNDFEFDDSYSFEIKNDKIFLVTIHKIVVCDTDGHFLREIDIPFSADKLLVFNDNEMIIGNYSKTMKTTDGGASWQKIKESWTERQKIIDFSDVNTGFMLFMDYCSTESFYVEVFTFENTTDGGANWKQGDGFVPDLNLIGMPLAKRSDGYVVIINKKRDGQLMSVFYHLKRKD